MHILEHTRSTYRFISFHQRSAIDVENCESVNKSQSRCVEIMFSLSLSLCFRSNDGTSNAHAFAKGMVGLVCMYLLSAYVRNKIGAIFSNGMHVAECIAHPVYVYTKYTRIQPSTDEGKNVWTTYDVGYICGNAYETKRDYMRWRWIETLLHTVRFVHSVWFRFFELKWKRKFF